MSHKLSQDPPGRPGILGGSLVVAGERRGDLNLAPVPADRGRQPSSACKFVLVGLASHAAPDYTIP
jgi:hypothetical protein